MKWFTKKSFSTSDQIKSFLTMINSTIDRFDGQVLLESNSDAQLWAVFTDDSVFLVKDSGEDLKCIYSKDKENFIYHIIRENNIPRLFIEGTHTTLPMGAISPVILEKTFNELKQQHA